ncbi:hypothetical protein BROUX41_003368 [Berkeleyomyces rouxiae]|uniref:uncharacterized protein n=1 Tax=Berkeleyomyces rouxiae TaxID=2035830 RepID=UPI003B80F1B8
MDVFCVGDHPTHAALPHSRRLLVIEAIIQQMIIGSATSSNLSLCPRMLNMPLKSGTGVIYAYGVNRASLPPADKEISTETSLRPQNATSFRFRPLLISVRFDSGSCAFAKQAELPPGRFRQLYDGIMAIYRRAAPRCSCKCPFCCRTCGRLADKRASKGSGKNARVRTPRMNSLMRAFLSPIAIDMTSSALGRNEAMNLSTLMSMSPPLLRGPNLQTAGLLSTGTEEATNQGRDESVSTSAWTFNLPLRTVSHSTTTTQAVGQ